MISATAWIARGRSARHPKRYDLDDAELERVSRMANVNLEDAKAQLQKAQDDIARGKDPYATGNGPDEEWQDDDDDENGDDDNDDNEDDEQMDTADDDKKPEDPDDLSKYNLDEYDDDAPVGTAMGAFSNIKGLQFYRSNDEDPYITVKDGADAEDHDDDRQELEVYPSDNLVLTAKTEDDVSQLEAYVYAASDSNLYVHHDLMLPSFPLCLEWLDYTPAPFDADQNGAAPAGTLGSFVAVGTMDPEIEIWSMDTVEGLYPDAILGRKDQTADLGLPLGTGKKKKKLTRSRIANAEYHVDAVLSLSWNPLARNLLASASADTTVKLWDLSRPNTGEDSVALRSFDAHTDKVQSVAWHAGAPGASACANPAVLLTGSYDKSIRIFDTRTPDVAVSCRIGADVEAVRWNGWAENEFMVSMESGLVQAFDARALPSSTSSLAEQANAPALFTLSAHDTACTSLDISPHIPGCILTGGSDKTVKIWNIESSGGSTTTAGAGAGAAGGKSINLVTSRDLGVGKVFSATFSPDDPMTIAAAGSAGKLQIWNALSNVGVRKTFGDRLRRLQGQYKVDIDGNEPARGDGVVGVVDDDDDDDDEGEEMQE
ncbi:uncharacterized protein PFL1_00658 [Pseudozyma flocculosa PF-1]|uniref:Related to WD repeat protein PWP1 n=1 Tax=Pseudozyma flocculosa TaxID=84751 RepID=A0A5C3ETY3_9BASI|nr:uncharacterized protein PFL1_00658 [Pseudozyma flocculosa PF-1]EPQ32463.1 hypothetical protein PFL1_00658 [Pseudozyma flocculosa PF-1]SPO34549.1 related to WD repeat protein PWP1 [Pseudozyma flocculosa]